MVVKSLLFHIQNTEFHFLKVTFPPLKKMNTQKQNKTPDNVWNLHSKTMKEEKFLDSQQFMLLISK